MIKAIIFDMDGVLVDSQEYYRQGYNFALSGLRKPLSDGEFRKLFGKSGHETFRDIIGKAGKTASQDAVSELVRKKDAFVREKFRAEVRTYPGVIGFVTEAEKSGLRLAVASNAVRKNIMFALRKLGILEKFEFILGNEDVVKKKPDPEIYIKCAGLFGLEPRECIVIEDSVYGIAAAKKGNFKSIAVTNTAAKARLHDADIVIAGMEGLSIKTIKELS